LEWNVTVSSATLRRRPNIAGSSVSIVVFELGTIRPIRYARERFVIDGSFVQPQPSASYDSGTAIRPLRALAVHAVFKGGRSQAIGSGVGWLVA